MTALIFEILSGINFIYASYVFFHPNPNNSNEWLFFMLSSVIMCLNAIRYDKDDNERV